MNILDEAILSLLLLLLIIIDIFLIIVNCGLRAVHYKHDCFIVYISKK